MRYTNLGKTGLSVSAICFGSLVMGPLQLGMPVEEGAQVMAYAFSRGINFVDTAEIYDTYPYIKRAAKIHGEYPIISTKCYAWDRETAAASLEKARQGMKIDVIDIFMLHEQESVWTLKGHSQAIEYFLEQKQKGRIRAFGVSTHYVEVVRAAGMMAEIDVIHPLVNMLGLGIQDGSAVDMLCAIEAAHDVGKGIFSMKALGGGNLINRYRESIDFVKDRPFIDSVAIGMQCKDEVDVNIAIFESAEPDGTTFDRLKARSRSVHIDSWCAGCGNCVKRCGQRAIAINGQGRAEIDGDKCVRCGYCSGVCPEFAIKIH